MPDFRTDLEKELHALVRELSEALGAPKLGRERFRDLMGNIRNARVHLDNKELGCASGQHAGPCKCIAHER